MTPTLCVAMIWVRSFIEHDDSTNTLCMSTNSLRHNCKHSVNLEYVVEAVGASDGRPSTRMRFWYCTRGSSTGWFGIGDLDVSPLTDWKRIPGSGGLVSMHRWEFSLEPVGVVWDIWSVGTNPDSTGAGTWLISAGGGGGGGGFWLDVNKLGETDFSVAVSAAVSLISLLG